MDLLNLKVTKLAQLYTTLHTIPVNELVEVHSLAGEINVRIIYNNYVLEEYNDTDLMDGEDILRFVQLGNKVLLYYSGECYGFLVQYRVYIKTIAGNIHDLALTDYDYVNEFINSCSLITDYRGKTVGELLDFSRTPHDKH